MRFTLVVASLLLAVSSVSPTILAYQANELDFTSLNTQSLLSRATRNTEPEPNSLYDSSSDPGLSDLNYPVDEFEDANPKLKNSDVDVFDPDAVSSHDSKENLGRQSSQNGVNGLSHKLPNKASGNLTQVNYCCEPDEVYDFYSMQCTPANSTATLKFHDHTGSPVLDVSHHPVVGFPNCSFYHLSPHANGEADQFIVSPEGELIIGELSANTDLPHYKVPQGRYCLIFPDPETMETVACFPDEKPEEGTSHQSFKLAVYPACLIVSAIFMLLTVLVYALVKELRCDQLSICFMCSIGMLALANICMVVSMWGIESLITAPACIVLASLSHFSFLSAFLWLNVISIMVLNSLWRSGSPSSCKGCGVQFYWKCLYCFGVAGLIAAAALIRQLVPAFHGSVLPAPHFGAVSCWFAKSAAMAVYLFGPITILLVINLVCFCLASFRICTLLKRSDRTNTHFVQYLKLFLLMGVSWIFEVISFFVDGSGNSFLSYAWIFFDFVNIMQGVLIFVVFVCRPSVLRHLATTLCGSACAARCFAPPEEKDRDDTEIAPCNTVV